MTIRVLIVDDHPVMRAGTQALLVSSVEIEVVGAVGTGTEALRLAENLRPDVVILDVRLPDISGVEVAQKMREMYPEVGIMVLTGYDDVGYVRTLLALGVQGYLRKTATGQDIITGVEAIVQGQIVISPDLMRFDMDNDGLDLTQREREVLSYIASGWRNKQIAETMGLSIKTVEFHVSRVLEKLGVHSRTEAMRVAHQRGLVNLDIE